LGIICFVDASTFDIQTSSNLFEFESAYETKNGSAQTGTSDFYNLLDDYQSVGHTCSYNGGEITVISNTEQEIRTGC
jgi:hypothetical protein